MSIFRLSIEATVPELQLDCTLLLFKEEQGGGVGGSWESWLLAPDHRLYSQKPQSKTERAKQLNIYPATWSHSAPFMISMSQHSRLLAQSCQPDSNVIKDPPSSTHFCVKFQNTTEKKRMCVEKYHRPLCVYDNILGISSFHIWCLFHIQFYTCQLLEITFTQVQVKTDLVRPCKEWERVAPSGSQRIKATK